MAENLLSQFPARSSSEIMQYRDGRRVRMFSVPGVSVQLTGFETAIIATEYGRRFAVGEGSLIELPKFNMAEQRFGKAGDRVPGVRTVDIPGGLAEVAIGAVWAQAQDAGSVTSVMFDCGTSERRALDPDAIQFPGQNPFDSATILLKEAIHPTSPQL